MSSCHLGPTPHAEEPKEDYNIHQPPSSLIIPIPRRKIKLSPRISKVSLAESVLFSCVAHLQCPVLSTIYLLPVWPRTVSCSTLLLWWWPGDLALITSPQPGPCPTLQTISTCNLQSVTVDSNWRLEVSYNCLNINLTTIVLQLSLIVPLKGWESRGTW